MANQTVDILFKLTASSGEIQKQLDTVSKLLLKAREDLKQLNSSYNLATKTIANYDTELGKLNLQLSQNEITTEQYNQSVEDLNADLKTAQKAVDDYAKSQVALKDDISRLSKEQNGYINDLRNVDRVTNEAEGSNEQLKASVALLRKEYNLLSKEERENTIRGKELTAQLREQTEALKENEKAVGDNRRNVGNYTSAFDGLTGGLSSTISSLVGPAGLVAGIGLATDLIGDGITAVQEITAEFVTLRGEVQGLTGVVGPELDSLTAKIKATSETFGTDFTEVLRLVNQQAKDFGIPFDKALTNIQAGFLASANNADKFTERLDEYSPILAKVGLTAEETNAIINQEIKSGIYGDKGIDSIKEAGERLALMEKPALAALEALQIDPETLKGKSIFEQVKLISAELTKLPKDSQAAAVAIEGIFGTPGLDVGQRYLETFANINTELQAQIDKTNPLTSLQIAQLDVAERLAGVQNELSKAFEGSNGELDLLIKEGKIFIIEVLLEAIKQLKPVIDGLKFLVNTLKFVGEGFGFVSDKINQVLKFLGFTETKVDILGSVMGSFVNILKQGFGLGLFDAIGKFRQSIIDTVAFIEDIPAIVSRAFNKVKQLSNDILGTDFTVDIPVEVNTQPAELSIKNLQEAINGLERPAPVPPDLSRFNVEAQAAKELTDKEIKEAERLAKERERIAKEAQQKLKILNQERIQDEIAAIKLRLSFAQQGSAEELTLTKNLIEKQTELTIQGRKSTANEVILIEREAQIQRIQIDKEFAAERLAVSVEGLKIQLQKELEIENISVSEDITRKANQVILNQETNEKILTLTQERIAKEGREEVETRTRTNEEITQLTVDNLSRISQLTGAFTSFFEAQKQKQLEAAQGNAEKEAEINEKFAKKEKKIAIFETIINTAAAIAKALPNIPLSITAGVIGAIQLATIKAQSFAAGGFTGEGLIADDNEPGRNIAGVVHDNEFVITEKALKNPEVMAAAKAIDALQSKPGFANGGFTTPLFSDGGISLNIANNQQNNRELAKLLLDGIKQLPEPIVSVKEITTLQNRVRVKEFINNI